MKRGTFWGFTLAVLSSALAGLIVWGVTEYLSERGTPRRVPSVVGHRVEDAMRVLGSHGFSAVEAEQRASGEREPGTVLAQRPEPDRLAAAGATIELTVEAESVPVPDLTGTRIEDAIRQLTDAELTVGSVAVEPPQSQSTGKVIGQDPSFPSRALPGQTVAMVVEGLRPEPEDEGDNDNGATRPDITLDPGILDRLDFRRLQEIEFHRPDATPPTPSDGEPQEQDQNQEEGQAQVGVIRPRLEPVRPPDRVLRTQTPVEAVQRFRLAVPPTPQPIAPKDGAKLSGAPRRVTLRWEPVEEAATYTVEVDVQSGDQWLTERGGSYLLNPDITDTQFTFEFIGPRPGRWRIWAVNEAGIASPKSDWQTFDYVD